MKKTIKKVLEELNRESPRLDYIRGMLEVLIEDEREPGLVVGAISSTPYLPIVPTIIKNNEIGEAIPMHANTHIDEIKRLAEESTEITHG